MSTMAASATNTPDVTWRDALTPLSRASRRRWTACYALLLVLLAASVMDDAFAVGRGTPSDQQIPLILLVGLLIVFGMLRRGTRRIAALDHPDLDERDVAARNSAYRIAFPLLVLVVVAALVLVAVGASDSVRTTVVGGSRVQHDGWFVDPVGLFAVALWIVLWAVFLPTGVLAWREPDALEPEPAASSLNEPLRDAVLGAALAADVAISLVADTDAGLWPFVAAIVLLGGLGRRAAGQPMVSRQRKWRVAIGMLLLLAVVFVALFAGSSGGGS